MADYRRNLANAVVGTMSNSTTATSIPLVAGYGPTMPATPFLMTFTPPGQLSTRGNSEIVIVNSVEGNMLNVSRAAKGTTAKSVGTGWIGSASVYVESSTAVGDIVMTLNASPQTGRLFMDGGTYNKAEYPLLWDHVSRNPGYGTVTETKFTLRDMRGRMPIGKASSGTFTSLGSAGGSETHTNTVGEMARHKHAISGAMPVDGSIFGLNDQGGDAVIISDNVSGAHPRVIFAGHENDTRGVQYGGDGRPWSIMNPYIVINFEVMAG